MNEAEAIREVCALCGQLAQHLTALTAQVRQVEARVSLLEQDKVELLRRVDTLEDKNA